MVSASLILFPSCVGLAPAMFMPGVECRRPGRPHCGGDCPGV